MKKILLFAFALFFLNVLSIAQHFDPPQENPFGLTETGHDGSAPAFSDLDGDGDFDLLSGRTGTGNFYYFKNIGTKYSPSFGAVQENPFGLTETGHDGSTPAFADLDGDGDFDLMSGRTGTGNFYYFKNIGTEFSPSFGTVLENPFGLTETGHDGSTPAFADLDGDGDLDLLSGRTGTGNFYYYENIGTKYSPSFGAVQENPFGLTETGHDGSTPAFADLDGDGDLDLMSGRTGTGNFYYYKNIGTKYSPSYGTVQENPFGLTETGHDNSTPAVADLDGDSDLDLISGRAGTGKFYYYKNTGSIGIYKVPKDLLPFLVFPNPTDGIFEVSIQYGKIQKIEIDNMLGKMISQTEVFQSNFKIIDLSSFPKGIYFVNIFDGMNYSFKKIVLK